MEKENQESTFNKSSKQFDTIKTLLIALFVLFAFSIFSFVVSIITQPSHTLFFKDYLNLFVMIISFLAFVTFLVIYIKNKKKK